MNRAVREISLSECIRFAAEADGRAAIAEDDRSRRSWIDLARSWRALALQLSHDETLH